MFDLIVLDCKWFLSVDSCMTIQIISLVNKPLQNDFYIKTMSYSNCDESS